MSLSLHPSPNIAPPLPASEFPILQMQVPMAEISPARFENEIKPKIIVDDFEIDQMAYRFRFRGKKIDLTLNEYFLLIHFLQNPDRVFSRRKLIEALGKQERIIDERIVDVWIRKLRRTFEREGIPDPFRTVRTVGYAFDQLDNC